jgi:hypothetical protein
MLFVHIGRAKCGSTTLQRFSFQNRATLLEHGIDYAAIGMGNTAHLPLVRAIQADSEALQAFDGELRGNPNGRYLVSAEHFFHLKPEHVRRLIEHAGGHEVRVIAYVRDYASWIRSCYSQLTKSGKSADDFDAYFNRMLRPASAVPALERWAQAVGWPNVHVRSLDPAGLTGGNLLDDFLGALGIELASASMRPPDFKNESPPWPVIEFRRAMTGLRAEAEPSPAIDHAERRLRKRFSRYLGKHPQIPQTAYLTPEQGEAATALYNRDVALLNERVREPLPLCEPSKLPDRSFLPTFDQVPASIRAGFFRYLDRRLALARFLPIKESRNLADLRQIRESLKAAYPVTRASPAQRRGRLQPRGQAVIDR